MKMMAIAGAVFMLMMTSCVSVPRVSKFDLTVLDSCGIVTNGRGHGSCVAIGPDLVLTAGHCLSSSDKWVEVGGERFEIVEEWTSDTYDVGLMRIDGTLPYVELGQMPDLLDTVYLVGSPYSTRLVNTITKGVVSYLDRDIRLGDNLIQTDAEGAPGSSGGPLFNALGQIVGTYSAYFQPGGGVALCVSVTDIRSALEEYNDER